MKRYIISMSLFNALIVGKHIVILAMIELGIRHAHFVDNTMMYFKWFKMSQIPNPQIPAYTIEDKMNRFNDNLIGFNKIISIKVVLKIFGPWRVLALTNIMTITFQFWKIY